MQHSPTACITLVIQQTTFQGVVYSEDNEHNHCLEFFWVSFYTRIQASKLMQLQKWPVTRRLQFNFLS